MKSFVDRLKNVVEALSIVAATAPLGFAIVSLLMLADACLPAAAAWAAKSIIDAIIAGRALAQTDGAYEAAMIHVKLWVGIEIALLLLSGGVDRSLTLLQMTVSSIISARITSAVLNHIARLDLQNLEDPYTADAIAQARLQVGRPWALVEDVLQIVASFAATVVYCTVLARFSPNLVLGMLAASMPMIASEICFSKKAFNAQCDRGSEIRRLNYLSEILTNVAFAKEIKCYNLFSPLISRFQSVSDRLIKNEHNAINTRARWGMLFSSLSSLAFYFCYVPVVAAAATHMYSVGTMTLYVMSLRRGRNSVDSLRGYVGRAYESSLHVDRVFRFLGRNGLNLNHDQTPLVRRNISERGVRFDGVCFSYPRGVKPVLENVSFFVPAGSCVAIVGENGSGKSTLMYLLAGLYKCSAGNIFIDGQTVDTFSTNSIAILFQDFIKFDFNLRDNIIAGDSMRPADDSAVMSVLRKSGAETSVRALPEGLDTLLGKSFEGGIQLSGGQWQRIALARALMRRDASMYILDEPTSALDPLGEKVFIDSLRKITNGNTVFMVTHRFPAARMADWIIVINGGKIAEQGTHEQLIASGGTYYRLFSVQSLV